MQALLKKQTETLNRLEEKAKMDNVIQLAQLYESRRIDADGDRVEEELKELNKNVKALNDKGGDGLNSNVVKLFKEIQKVGTAITSRGINNQEAEGISAKVGERRQFNTLKPRVENFKEGFKDFFTMRGFLDKTGIAERGSGGLVSEYLDRGEARNKYANDRLKVDESSTNMEAGRIAKAAGVDYKTLSDEDKQAYKSQASDNLRKTYKEQFNKQQEVQFDVNKNEKALKQYREDGFTDKQIERTPEFKRRAELATEMAKVDTRVRPEGFDARTGKVKEKVEAAVEESKPKSAGEQQVEARPSAEIIPFTGASTASAGGLAAASAEEAMLEQNRMVAQQTGLLTKIEENTRALKASAPNEPKQRAPEPAEEGSSLLDMGRRGAGRLGRIARTAGRGLMSGVKTAGSFLAKRAGPLAAISTVGAGAYAGYQGYQAAGEKEQESLKAIDAKVASGEITEQQANTLRQESKEGATVERGGAAGKGVGMAAGGAAGALKGAAAGAAIGSVVPVVGTVIGGAIGAGLGAVGGSWLGGKGGEWVGEQAGKVKNWFSSDSKQTPNVAGPTTASPVAPVAPVAPGDKTIQVLKKRAEAVTPSVTMAPAVAKTVEGSTSPQVKPPTPAAAKPENDPFTVDGKTMPKKLRETISKMDKADGERSIAAWKVLVSDNADNQTKMGAGQILEKMTTKYSENNAAKLKPADSPSTGNVISKQSGDNEQAKMDASKGGNNTAIVAAPTVNNNQTVQNTPVKLPPRNTDSTVNKYMQSRWAF
jgi:hypothetical protein